MKSVVRFFSVLFLFISLTVDTSFAGSEMEKAGRELANRLCAKCHAVGAAGDSPFKSAPPFRTFSQKWPLESLEEALAEGIVVGHEDMPEFKLKPEEIGSLILYLKTL